MVFEDAATLEPMEVWRTIALVAFIGFMTLVVARFVLVMAFRQKYRDDDGTLPLAFVTSYVQQSKRWRKALATPHPDAYLERLRSPVRLLDTLTALIPMVLVLALAVAWILAYAAGSG